MENFIKKINLFKDLNTLQRETSAFIVDVVVKKLREAGRRVTEGAVGLENNYIPDFTIIDDDQTKTSFDVKIGHGVVGKGIKLLSFRLNSLGISPVEFRITDTKINISSPFWAELGLKYRLKQEELEQFEVSEKKKNKEKFTVDEELLKSLVQDTTYFPSIKDFKTRVFSSFEECSDFISAFIKENLDQLVTIHGIKKALPIAADITKRLEAAIKDKWGPTEYSKPKSSSWKMYNLSPNMKSETNIRVDNYKSAMTLISKMENDLKGNFNNIDFSDVLRFINNPKHEESYRRYEKLRHETGVSKSDGNINKNGELEVPKVLVYNSYFRKSGVGRLDYLATEYPQLNTEQRRRLLKKMEQEEKEREKDNTKRSRLSISTDEDESLAVVTKIKEALLVNNESYQLPFDVMLQKDIISNEFVQNRSKEAIEEFDAVYDKLKSKTLFWAARELYYASEAINYDNAKGNKYNTLGLITTLDKNTLSFSFGHKATGDYDGKPVTTICCIRKDEEELARAMKAYFGNVQIHYGEEYIWLIQSWQLMKNNRVTRVANAQYVMIMRLICELFESSTVNERREMKEKDGTDREKSLFDDMMNLFLMFNDATFRMSEYLDLFTKLRIGLVSDFNNVESLIMDKLSLPIGSHIQNYIVNKCVDWCVGISNAKTAPNNLFKYKGRDYIFKWEARTHNGKVTYGANIQVTKLFSDSVAKSVSELINDIQWEKVGFSEARALFSHTVKNWNTIVTCSKEADFLYLSKLGRSLMMGVFSSKESISQALKTHLIDRYKKEHELFGTQDGFIGEVIYWSTYEYAKNLNLNKDELFKAERELRNKKLQYISRTKASASVEGEKMKAHNAIIDLLKRLDNSFETVEDCIIFLLKQWSKPGKHRMRTYFANKLNQQGSSREFYIKWILYFILNFYVDTLFGGFADKDEKHNQVNARDKQVIITTEMRHAIELEFRMLENEEYINNEEYIFTEDDYLNLIKHKVDDELLDKIGYYNQEGVFFGNSKGSVFSFFSSKDMSKWAPKAVCSEYCWSTQALYDLQLISVFSYVVIIFHLYASTYKTIESPQALFISKQLNTDRLTNLNTINFGQDAPGKTFNLRRVNKQKINLEFRANREEDPYVVSKLEDGSQFFCWISWLNGMLQRYSSFVAVAQMTMVNQILENLKLPKIDTYFLHSDDKGWSVRCAESDFTKIWAIDTIVELLTNKKLNKKKSHGGKQLMEYLSTVYVRGKSSYPLIKKINSVMENMYSWGYPKNAVELHSRIFADFIGNGASLKTAELLRNLANQILIDKYPTFTRFWDDTTKTLSVDYTKSILSGGLMMYDPATWPFLGTLSHLFWMSQSDVLYQGAKEYMHMIYTPRTIESEEEENSEWSYETSFSVPYLPIFHKKDAKISKMRWGLTLTEEEEMKKVYKMEPWMMRSRSHKKDLATKQMQMDFNKTSFVMAYSDLSKVQSNFRYMFFKRGKNWVYPGAKNLFTESEVRNQITVELEMEKNKRSLEEWKDLMIFTFEWKNTGFYDLYNKTARSFKWSDDPKFFKSLKKENRPQKILRKNGYVGLGRLDVALASLLGYQKHESDSVTNEGLIAANEILGQLAKHMNIDPTSIALTEEEKKLDIKDPIFVKKTNDIYTLYQLGRMLLESYIKKEFSIVGLVRGDSVQKSLTSFFKDSDHFKKILEDYEVKEVYDSRVLITGNEEVDAAFELARLNYQLMNQNEDPSLELIIKADEEVVKFNDVTYDLDKKDSFISSTAQLIIGTCVNKPLLDRNEKLELLSSIPRTRMWVDVPNVWGDVRTKQGIRKLIRLPDWTEDESIILFQELIGRSFVKEYSEKNQFFRDNFQFETYNDRSKRSGSFVDCYIRNKISLRGFTEEFIVKLRFYREIKTFYGASSSVETLYLYNITMNYPPDEIPGLFTYMHGILRDSSFYKVVNLTDKFPSLLFKQGLLVDDSLKPVELRAGTKNKGKVVRFNVDQDIFYPIIESHDVKDKFVSAQGVQYLLIQSEGFINKNPAIYSRRDETGFKRYYTIKTNSNNNNDEPFIELKNPYSNLDCKYAMNLTVERLDKKFSFKKRNVRVPLEWNSSEPFFYLDATDMEALVELPINPVAGLLEARKELKIVILEILACKKIPCNPLKKPTNLTLHLIRTYKALGKNMPDSVREYIDRNIQNILKSEELNTSDIHMYEVFERLTSDKRIITADLLQYYSEDIRPYFKNGKLIDEEDLTPELSKNLKKNWELSEKLDKFVEDVNAVTTKLMKDLSESGLSKLYAAQDDKELIRQNEYKILISRIKDFHKAKTIVVKSTAEVKETIIQKKSNIGDESENFTSNIKSDLEADVEQNDFDIILPGDPSLEYREKEKKEIEKEKKRKEDSNNNEEDSDGEKEEDEENKIDEENPTEIDEMVLED